jgi:adenylosuccinate lyase
MRARPVQKGSDQHAERDRNFEAASTLADQRASVEALDRRQLDLWLLTQLGAESQL